MMINLIQIVQLEFSGNTMSWKDYKKEALKCRLVCSNCHKEIHSELGYSIKD